MNSRWLRQWPAFGDMQREFDRVFADMFRGQQRSFAAAFPPINIHEDEESITVTAAVPGAEASAFDVKVEGDVLMIEGELPENPPPRDGRVLRRERLVGKFVREIPLPKSVKTNGVEANYVDGILSVVMPKTAEARPQIIKVRAGNSAQAQEITNG